MEDGSRGEEGGCRESNYMEEEIEQSSISAAAATNVTASNTGGNNAASTATYGGDAPELGVHPQSSSAAAAQQ